MNRKESTFFLLGIALSALLLTLVLDGATTPISMAQSPIPTWTFTPTPM